MATTTARRDRAVEVQGRPVTRWAQDNGQEHGFVDVEHQVEILATCATYHDV